MADPVPGVTISAAELFPASGEPDPEPFFQIAEWLAPVTYFVGRNGSGKSRTAKAIAQRTNARLLATDRLVGLMAFNNYGWGSAPVEFRGVPLGDENRAQIHNISQSSGTATDELYALREQPEVWLRVAAFLRRALGREIELRESAGFLDPYVRHRDNEYSLLRDEGHGLRELVVLLTAAYRTDWSLLVIDEPELHLHPSMARLWLSELIRECREGGRHAIVVTHEPNLIRPASYDDLRAIWHFAAGERPSPICSHVRVGDESRVAASLQQNALLVSQLVFSPRPVLVEGLHDAAALTTAVVRTQQPEAVAQTDFINCGGSGGVALWYEIAQSMHLDVRAVADLDALLAPEVKRSMDATSSVVEAYRNDLATEPATTSQVLRPLIEAMQQSHVPSDSTSRAAWLAKEIPSATGFEIRLATLLQIWRDAGLWLHPQGTLEDVLGLTTKGVTEAQTAAQRPGPIDDVAGWCSYSLDTLGDIGVLLNAATERIAHGIMEAQRVNPQTQFRAPVGSNSITDSRLVTIEPLAVDGHYRLVVVTPPQFAGYWMDFSRATPATELELKPPRSVDYAPS